MDIRRCITRFGFGQTLLLACLIVTPLHASPPGGVRNSAEIRESGDIRGSVALCTPEAAAGLIVYIPGQSFSVITGTGGDFNLHYLPDGTYKLVVMKNGQVMESLSGVNVKPKKITDVGVIDLNRDQDNDSYDTCVDCNDLNPNINPGASEVCDGVDNNCNGLVDEGCPTCTDSDHDGFFAQVGCGTPVDCDDANAAVNPGAMEACQDGIDNNCDGGIDEGCLSCTPGTACGSPAGQCHSEYDNACNCVQVVGPSQEICDGLDNNCDGQVDEGCPSTDCVDRDGDGFFDSAPGCQVAVFDCNDADSQVYPGATEYCNGVDDNCNGQVDEGLPTNWTSMPFGTWRCSQGVIQTSCNVGRFNCDGDLANGCESISTCP